VKQFPLKGWKRNDYYVPNLKNMVLEMRYKGRNIKPGDKVLKSSKSIWF
jgi:hypothetical protein